jgi:hypothetical protein
MTTTRPVLWCVVGDVVATADVLVERAVLVVDEPDGGLVVVGRTVDATVVVGGDVVVGGSVEAGLEVDGLEVEELPGVGAVVDPASARVA